MNILFVNRFCWPDRVGTGKVLYECCEDIVASGHSVSVVCSDSLTHDPSVRLARHEVVRGVSLHRVRSFRFSRQSVIGWFINAISFYPWALVQVLLLPAHSVTVFLTDPPLLFVLGPVVRFFKKTRIVCWSQDVYPEVAVGVGVLSASSVFTRLVVRLSSASLRSFDRVIALGDAMKERLIAKGVAPAALSVVHNWADGAVITPSAEPDSFSVMYSGNFGLSHEFDTLIAAASVMRGSGVRFVFVGSGKQYQAVKAAASGTSCVFLPFADESALSVSLGSGSVHVVSLKAGLSGLLVPSKLYGCLAAGRPVLYVGESSSEGAEIILTHHCGMVVAPGDVAGLVSAILFLRDHPEERQWMGRNGRAVFEKTYARPLGTESLRKILDAVGAGG